LSGAIPRLSMGVRNRVILVKNRGWPSQDMSLSVLIDIDQTTVWSMRRSEPLEP